jgi:hypothetical protein
MGAVPGAAEVIDPRQAGVGGLGEAVLDVELEDALGKGGPLAGEPVLVGIAGARIARQQLADRDLVRRPVSLEVLQELVPALETVAVHVALRKGERMVEPDDGGLSARDFLQQPLGEVAAAPPAVLLVAGIQLAVGLVVVHGREDLDLADGIPRVLAARVAHADVVMEIRHGSPPRRESYQLEKEDCGVGSI